MLRAGASSSCPPAREPHLALAAPAQALCAASKPYVNASTTCPRARLKRCSLRLRVASSSVRKDWAARPTVRALWDSGRAGVLTVSAVLGPLNMAPAPRPARDPAHPKALPRAPEHRCSSRCPDRVHRCLCPHLTRRTRSTGGLRRRGSTTRPEATEHSARFALAVAARPAAPPVAA